MLSLPDVVIRVLLFVVRLCARLVTEKLRETTVYLLNGFAIWIACICNKSRLFT